MSGKLRKRVAWLVTLSVTLVLVTGQFPVAAFAASEHDGAMTPVAVESTEAEGTEETVPAGDATEPTDEAEKAVEDEKAVEAEVAATEAVANEKPEAAAAQKTGKSSKKASEAAPAASDKRAKDTYKLYWYGLIPGLDIDDVEGVDPNEAWLGLGVSTISGVKSPSEYPIKTDVTDDIEAADAEVSQQGNPKLFPNIRVNGKEYKYAAKGSANADKEGYYTVTPARFRVSDGANKGNNNYNTEVENGTNTYHYDHVITLNEADYVTAQFQVKYPGSSTFASLPNTENAQHRVKKGTNESKIEQPIPDDKNADGFFPEITYSDGFTYVFDGWYRDEACTQKVTFNQDLIDNTVYYGHYVKKAGNFSLTKQVAGNAANDTEHFTFVVSGPERLNGAFDVTYTNSDDSAVNDDASHVKTLTFKNGAASSNILLKHGETATVEGLPTNIELSVKEINLSGNAKTEVTASVDGTRTTVKPESSTATETDVVKVPITFDTANKKPVTTPVVFTNRADLTTPTGIDLNVTPMVGLLAVAAAGGAALVMERTRATGKSGNDAWKE